MAKPLLYQPMPRRQVFAALGGALAIQFTAVVIAGIHPQEPEMDLAKIPDAIEVTMEQEPAPPEPTPPPEEVEVPPPPAPTETPEFVEEKPTPPPRPHPQTSRPPPQPISKTMSSARANATFLPKPSYPYEARKGHITGSGVCVLTLDPAGNVSDATMAVSTGSPILDNATTSALRRARFKPGTASKVKTPITFTMEGAQF